MKICTEAEYEEALDAFIRLVTGPNARPFNDPGVLVLDHALDAYKETATSYSVVCKKAHYAGQGVSWEAGDEYTYTYSRRMAEETLDRLNRCSLGDGDCWELVVGGRRSVLTIL